MVKNTKKIKETKKSSLKRHSLDFKSMQTELKNYDSAREELIKKSRDVLKLSKQLIYALHRNELTNATKLLKQITTEKKLLDKISQKNEKLKFEGSYKIAVQEYVEAQLYYSYLKHGTLTKINCSTFNFMLGLGDLPGELLRRAVYLAGKGQYQEVVEIKDLVGEIYIKLLEFDFRQGEMRKKMDSIKYVLHKLEDLVLELKLKDRI